MNQDDKILMIYIGAMFSSLAFIFIIAFLGVCFKMIK